MLYLDVLASGDQRFRLDFPWAQEANDKTLQLRSSNSSLKKSWIELLTATLKEATSQIKGTGTVFAYGGEEFLSQSARHFWA